MSAWHELIEILSESQTPYTILDINKNEPAFESFPGGQFLIAEPHVD